MSKNCRSSQIKGRLHIMMIFSRSKAVDRDLQVKVKGRLRLTLFLENAKKKLWEEEFYKTKIDRRKREEKTWGEVFYFKGGESVKTHKLVHINFNKK